MDQVTSDLVRRLQAAESQLVKLRSTKGSVPSATQVGGFGLVMLPSIVPVDSAVGSAGVAWTTFDVSESVPIGARFLYLRIWAMIDGAGCDGSIEIRANDGSPEYTAAKLAPNGGSATDDTNSDTVIALFPLDGMKQSFDYQVTVVTDIDFAIEIWGYAA